MQDEEKDTDHKEPGQEQEALAVKSSGVATDATPGDFLTENQSPIDQNGQPDQEMSIGFLKDVQVTVAVEIGRRKLPIQQILSLTPGSILDLEKDLEEPLELLVNGTLIAKGEVVVQKNKFGIRLVDVCTNNDRKKHQA